MKKVHQHQVWLYCRDSEKEPRLKPDRPEGSSDANDYSFGLQEGDINEYRRLADILFASMTFFFGPQSMTSYIVKLIDYIPAFLVQGDIPSLMR